MHVWTVMMHVRISVDCSDACMDCDDACADGSEDL